MKTKTKNAKISIRVNEELKKYIEEQAEEQGISVNEYIIRQIEPKKDRKRRVHREEKAFIYSMLTYSGQLADGYKTAEAAENLVKEVRAYAEYKGCQ